LHNIAIAFGGVSTEQGRIALNYIEPRDDGVSVIGSAIRAKPIDAALANSVLIRALRMEDVLLPAATHPGATLIPAALAVGEAEGASGADIITALVAGYDLLSRAAGRSSAVPEVGRSPHHVFGPLATAAVAARLMRLDVGHTAGAIAYGSNLATMTYAGFQDFQYGLITHNGVFAAEMGRIGAPYPIYALEGSFGFYQNQLLGRRPSDEELLAELGSRFDIMNTAIKPHPCTGANLVTLELLRAAMREHGLNNDNIRRLRATKSDLLRTQPNIDSKGPYDAARGGPPEGAVARGMYVATTSLPFALANIVHDGEITKAGFDFPDAPHLVPIMAKIEMDYETFVDELYSRLEIETTDGRVLRSEGGIEMIKVPDSAAILRENAADVIGPEKAERLLAAINALDTAPNLRAVTSCFI
jgi:2-methylcitrate dehydratase PrpD